MLVLVNGSPVATGSFLQNAKCSTIISGLQSINYPLSVGDEIKIQINTPSWATNPNGVRHDLTALVYLY
jgi:hypothetical protein